MVHQHFMLVPVFTVTENIMLGAEQVRGGIAGFLDRRRARREVAEVSERYNLRVDPDAVIEDLPVGIQQRVEIVKALTRDVDLLILDEPTAVLTPQETEELLTVMRSLKAAGKSIVFITHKLGEVKAIADRITVIRRGKTVGTASPEASRDELAALMVGRTVRLTVDKAPATPGEPVLELANLVVDDDRQVRAVDGVDLTVRAGEVLGVAGVQGNGQTELIEAIMGLRPVLAGTITLDGSGSTAGRPRRCSGRASATCRRTAASTVWSRSSPSRRTWCWTCTTGHPSAGGCRCGRTRSAGPRGNGSSSSTYAPRRQRRRSAPFPAVTSRK